MRCDQNKNSNICIMNHNVSGGENNKDVDRRKVGRVPDGLVRGRLE